MFKITKNIIVSLSLLAFFSVFGSTAHAAQVPSLALYPTTGSSVVQITIIGADPNAPVSLHYISGSSFQTTNIGTTNSIGYLNTTLDSTANKIAVGAQVYVVVDGQASPSALWPNYAVGGGNISLSQTSLVLSVGQNMIVVASVSSQLSIASNSNPTAASATVSSNQVNISALAIGSTNISVCAAGIGCGSISVTVASSGLSVPPNIYINQNRATINPGQSLAVGISGSGSYYVSNNSNPGVAVGVMNGSSLTVTGLSSGTTVLSLCASSTNGSSNVCIPLTITVLVSTSTDTTTLKTISFSQSQPTLTKGQILNDVITGSASKMFSIKSNSNPTIVGAGINGTDVVIEGLGIGGSNISVCEYGGVCGNIYAYIQTPGVVSAPTVPVQTNTPTTTSTPHASSTSPALAFTFSTYLHPGLTNTSVSLLQTLLVQKGYLNHVVTGFYGQSTKDAVMKLQRANSIEALGVVGPATRTLLNKILSSTTTSTTASFVFKKLLSSGMINSDVTELQKKLASLGLYAGSITGSYGPLTASAVKMYQTKHKISPLGNVGPATLKSLNSN
jgi:peptidoglycan hydrolase-like protein with peptidoglycan-binding domain